MSGCKLLMYGFKTSNMIVFTCLVIVVLSSSGYTTDDISIGTASTTSPSWKAKQHANCNATGNPKSGSSLAPGQSATVICTCQGATCPYWNSDTVQEYITKEYQFQDKAKDQDGTNQHCSSILEFSVKNDLKVGDAVVEISCRLPLTEDNFIYQINVHTPHSDEWWNEYRKSEIFIILATICFILMTLTMLGICFRCRSMARRRCASASSCQHVRARHRNRHLDASSNQAFVNDNPPPYAQAINCPPPLTLPPAPHLLAPPPPPVFLFPQENTLPTKKDKLIRLAHQLRIYRIGGGSSSPLSKPDEPVV